MATDKGAKPRRRAKIVAFAALAAALLAAAYVVEFFGGEGRIPSWDRLYHAVGLTTNLPQTDARPQNPNTARVTVLDVGQGDAVLLEQNGAYALVDAGTWDAGPGLVRQLQGAGAESLELLVMTHPHADHMGGMPEVLKNIGVKTLLLPDLTGAEENNVVEQIQRLAAEQGTAIVPAEDGQEYPLGSGTLTVLGTGVVSAAESTDDAANDRSLALRFTAGNFSFLTTGDAETEEETALVAQYGGALHSTLLKAGHHGSATSSTEDFLKSVSPQAIAISCGLENDYGHPHAAALRRMQQTNAEIWRTDEQGSVTFLWDGTALQATATGREEEALAPAA